MDFLTGMIENPVLWGVLTTVARIIIIWVAAKIVVAVASKAVERFFQHSDKSRNLVNSKRSETLTKLVKSIVHYVVYFIAVITTLEIFVSITPLLTGAGVLGLAVGFGAQGFVKDVVTGFFILFEGQFEVGDKVQINAVEGTVEELAIRTTVLKGENGEMYYISNGSILQVANLSAVGKEEEGT